MLTLVAMADTHLFHADLEIPDGDILIHAGDLSRNRAHGYNASRRNCTSLGIFIRRGGAGKSAARHSSM
jgi:hypothetical protein